MNRFLVLLFASVCVLFGLSACEAEGGGSSSLEGHYVLQKVEIHYDDGEYDIYDEPEDFTSDDDDILFDYEYIFKKDGSYSFRGAIDENMVSGCTYSVKGNTLKMSATSLWSGQLNAYKIISNSGETLVLEPTKEILDLNNEVNKILGWELITKTRGTYLKK